MSYGRLIEDSFRLGWRRKSLWILGLFASGGANYGVNLVDDDVFDSYGGSTWSDSELGIALVLAMVVFAIVVAIVGVILHVISEGGLVDACRALSRGEATSLGHAWSVGARHGLSVFVVFLAGTFLIFLEGALFVGIPLMAGILVHPMLGVLVGFLGAPVLALALLATIPVLVFATRAIVLEGRSVGDALARGVEILRRRPLQCAAVGLTRCLVSIGVGMVSFALVAAAAIPLVLAWAISPVLAVAMGISLAGPVILALGGYTGCAASYFWTLAFDQLTALDAEPEPDERA